MPGSFLLAEKDISRRQRARVGKAVEEGLLTQLPRRCAWAGLVEIFQGLLNGSV